MASTGQPNSSNSQFFIVYGDASFLDGKYSVVGEVASGMDVADKLKKAPPGSQSGSVANPDKMVKVQVAADMK
jgi:peptidylprolyl isomerase